MNARVPLAPESAHDVRDGDDALFERLLREGPRATAAAPPTSGGLVMGELLALREDGIPLVAVPGHDARALPAMSLIDLHAVHIGQRVALMFDGGDPERPVVIGLPRGQSAWPLESRPAQVDVDVDGQRLVVTAEEQLVLRCGKASITLTKAGKVLIEGSYLLSRSTGVNRIKGGSVQLN